MLRPISVLPAHRFSSSFPVILSEFIEIFFKVDFTQHVPHVLFYGKNR